MSITELVLNMLAETATKDITQISNPQGLDENRKVAPRGAMWQKSPEKVWNKK